CLAKLTLTHPSWLGVDEPTNHFDLGGGEARAEKLGGFPGALVFVSHDREFMDGLCNQVLEVGDGVVKRYVGNYSAWRAAKLAEAEARDEKKELSRQQEKEKARARATVEVAQVKQAAQKK